MNEKLKKMVSEAVGRGWEDFVEKAKAKSAKKGGKGAGAYYSKMHGPFDSRGPGPIIDLILKGKGGKKGKKKVGKGLKQAVHKKVMKTIKKGRK